MADLLAVSTPLSKPIIQYAVLHEAKRLRMDAIHGRVNNMQLLTYLASCDYNSVDLKVKDILRPNPIQ